MAEPAKNFPASSVNHSSLTVRLHGQIDRFEKYEGDKNDIYTTTIIIPTSDPMASPTRLQVKSTKKLGSLEEMIDIKAIVRSRYWKPKSGGDVRYNPELWLVAD